MSSRDRTRRSAAPHRAGLTDVRTVIGLLVGFYGIVLVIMGLTGESAEDRAKTGDVNANLWAGLAMLVFGALMVLWAWLRPVIVDPDEVEPPSDEEQRAAAPPSRAGSSGVGARPPNAVVSAERADRSPGDVDSEIPRPHPSAAGRSLRLTVMHRPGVDLDHLWLSG